MTNNNRVHGKDMPADELRRQGHRLVDWVADFYAGLGDQQPPARSVLEPGWLRDRLPRRCPQQGEPIETVFEDVDRLLMPAMTHWTHPSFFAYFTSSSSGPGLLGEMMAAALNANCMNWLSCPAGTELEEVVTDWLRDLLGLPEGFFGVIFDGGSASNLHGLAAAREAADLDIRQRGLVDRPDLPKMRVYCSEEAHSSIDKAVLALGLGLESLQKIATDDRLAMQPELLARAIEEDRQAGWLPLCVVATVGSTSSTAIDPVAAIADICATEDVWLHVDASYGGAAAVAPEMRWVIDGCDRADSFVINPHKWLFVPLGCSVLFTRRREILARAFSLTPDYLKDNLEGGVTNYMDYGIPLGRRMQALKLWFMMRCFGSEALARIINDHVAMARELAETIAADPLLEIPFPPPLGTVCFRCRPPEVDDPFELDRLNQQLLEAINRPGELFLTATRLRGVFTLRLVIGNIRTSSEHISRAWQRIKEALDEVLGG